MSMETVPLAVTIGLRVRSGRQARGWTLDRLADEAGVSRRQVINVEKGEANPSIGTLLALSDALGIGLPALVDPPTSRLVKITKAGEAAQLWSGERGGRGVLLVGTQPPDVVELWEWELRPGERHSSAAHQAGTRELLHVHHGAMSLTVHEDEFHLTAGDAITFPGDIAHSYNNEGAHSAVFTLTVYEPGVGANDDRRGRNV